MTHLKPFECGRCGACCKTVQGLRGHERFRHGVNASPARRFRARDGEVVRAGDNGLTFNEAIEEARWQLLIGRLDGIERLLRELSRVRK